MIVYFLSGKHFQRSRDHEILLLLSIMGVWKNNKKSMVDKCASHVTLFVQALSLEVAALAIKGSFGKKNCVLHLAIASSRVDFSSPLPLPSLKCIFFSNEFAMSYILFNFKNCFAPQ